MSVETRNLPTTKILLLFARTILRHAGTFKWSLQGLGMLRLYLSPEVRLHVWDRQSVVSDVSTLHDHPWNFTSYVLAGSIVDVEYDRTLPGSGAADAFIQQRIVCGPGGHLAGDPVPVLLREKSCRVYGPGSCYTHLAQDIHESIPCDGTVTLIVRDFVGDRDHANVYYPIQMRWVSAEPRPALPEEVTRITSKALECMSTMPELAE